MTVTNPTAQRRLRGHLPARPADRDAVSPTHLKALARRLTSRDRWLARMLYEHRVLTSPQLALLAFGVTRGANRRLLDLYRWRVVDRFQPFVTTGAAPMYYVLDIAGAAVLAAEHGTTTKELGYRHDRALAIAQNLRLAHTVAVNGVFTALVAVARHSGDPAPDGTSERALTTWWSEARCARYFGEHVRPDGYGRWREHASTGIREVEFFLEYDFGTEALSKVAAKLAYYQRLATATGIATPVLFWFPTTAREQAAREAFGAAYATSDQACTLVPVATTASDLTPHPIHGSGSEVPDNPAGARWMPLTPAGPRRIRLAQLGQTVPARAGQAATGRGAAPNDAAAGAGGTLLPPDPMPPASVHASYHFRRASSEVA